MARARATRVLCMYHCCDNGSLFRIKITALLAGGHARLLEAECRFNQNEGTMREKDDDQKLVMVGFIR
ncbi:hypothetical protein COLO4_17674 [Corchorus olitorius]|uniref:Uncharacterized protein n=1 Tax=Corchorus olitorius TaxID=93759 RepID=A0A1R3JBY2_9ROSI|nr:hypothetical protein COLO4_17674 [Corchorus olitorius]